MLGRKPFNDIKSELLWERLEAFEQFCMGERHLSPEDFTDINKELSIGAVLCIGRHAFKNNRDGRHLIWIDLTDRRHDLGEVTNLNVMSECPGFHRGRTLALTKDADVATTEIIDVPPYRRQMTKVVLEDGSHGIGPDYKMALRNAALKKHLKSQFNKARGFSFWDLLGGSA